MHNIIRIKTHMAESPKGQVRADGKGYVSWRTLLEPEIRLLRGTANEMERMLKENEEEQ